MDESRRGCIETMSPITVSSREIWAPLDHLVFLVLLGSLARQVLEERRVSQAPVENG